MKRYTALSRFAFALALLIGALLLSTPARAQENNCAPSGGDPNAPAIATTADGLTVEPCTPQADAEVLSINAPAEGAAVTAAIGAEPSATTIGITYYVDCVSGNDTFSGTAPTQAWKSTTRANKALLRPGDALRLKRGCTWTTRLDASWVGTAAQPILISTYDSGALPRIHNGINQNVKITGSYQIIEYLETSADPLSVDPNCKNQPVGWTVGFNFFDTATYNTVRFSKASGHMAGIRVGRGSHHNTIVNNTLINNNALQVLDNTNSTNDLGAWGILINGNDNEIAHNSLSNNNAWCSYDYGMTGNSIELYEAQRNYIHHNTAVNDMVFSELGGSSTRKSEDNVYVYNLHTSSVAGSRFLVVRGGGNVFGPTWRTRAYNNTIHFTGPTSQGIVCHSGCSASILTLRNNIIWANEKAAYADAPFAESNNLYWSTNGAPVVQFQGGRMHSTSRIGNPQFVDAVNRNYRLLPSTPALDKGTLESVNLGYTSDLAMTPVFQGLSVDMGAYEYKP